MSRVDRLNILTELGFRILKSSNPEVNASFSIVSILSNLQYCLQAGRADTLIEEINNLLQLPQNESERNVKIISELIKNVIYGDSKFVTINLACGVYLSLSGECTGYPEHENIILLKGSKSIDDCNEEIAKVSEKFQCLIRNEYKPMNGITIFGAMEFKAPFLNLFKIGSTEMKEFHASSTHVINVPMMQYGGMILYNENEEAGVRMMRHHFYGGNFYMVVMVPKKRFGLADMEKRLTSEKYTQLLKNLRSVLGKISIPKLSLNYNTDLKTILETLGLKFDNCKSEIDYFVHGVSADFNEFGSNVPTRDLKESEKHGQCLGGFTKPPERQEIIADEPFLLSINYAKDHSVVLLSRVLIPTVMTEH